MKKCESCGGTGLIAVCSCERGTSSSCIATGAVGNHAVTNIVVVILEVTQRS